MDFIYFLLLPVTFGIAWIVLYLVMGRYHLLHDRLLLAFLACGVTTYYILMRALYSGTDSYSFIALDNIESFVALWMCPLMFLYIRTVVRDARWNGWYGYLFVPGMLVGVVGTALSFVVGWDVILEGRVNDFVTTAPAPVNLLEKVYVWVNIDLFNCIIVVMNIILTVFSTIHLRKYYRNANSYYSNIEESSVSRIHNILLATISIQVSIILITVLIKYVVGLRDDVLLGFSLWFVLLEWVIAYNAFRIKLTEKHVEALSLIEEIVMNDDSVSTTGQEYVMQQGDEIAQKISDWENRKDKPFCRESLTVKGVAEEIGVSARVLSSYINKHKNMNFNRWINGLRIEEAKRLLSISNDIPISNLAYDLGFTDHAAFTNVFRQMVGCSPLAYRNSERK